MLDHTFYTSRPCHMDGQDLDWYVSGGFTEGLGGGVLA